MRIALFQPDIPQNTGNILRLGACFDIHVDIIGPTGFRLDDKRIRRSAMDYIENVNYKQHLDWKNFYEWTRENNFNLILITTKVKNIYYNYKFQNKDILLFGQESAGVPEEIHKIVKNKLTIPMTQGMRSINLSSAVAIVASEACKQLNNFN
tara:strand:+ start:580 stop:1035 length:456 start_codon:yes stop_codon:yes gene_type:complete